MTSPVSERDRWFESGFLQRRVHKLSVLFAPHAHLSAAHTAGEETVVYLARNWKFESTSLQQRVCELSVPERRDHFPARTP
jgi:hypothetical protein